MDGGVCVGSCGGDAEGYLGEVVAVANVVKLSGIHGGPGARLSNGSRVWRGQTWEKAGLRLYMTLADNAGVGASTRG